MAYLNSLVVTGSSRFLNKVYAGEIEVSEELSTTGNMAVGGTLSVTGATTLGSTLGVSGAASITGTLTLSKTTDASGTANNSPALIVGGAATGAHMEFSKNRIQSKNTGTTVANMSINPDGGLVTIGSGGLTVTGTTTLGTANITTGNISTLSATTGTAGNFNVTNILRATQYDLQSVAQLGGAFYVAPTIKLPNSGTTFTVTVANGYLTIVISDSSITSTTIAGVVWAANAKVKASGKIGNVVTGTMDGTVTAINTTAHTLTIRVAGENSAAVTAGTYSASQIDNFCVMLYQTSDSKPVGIVMNSYGTNNLAYIDIYGGSSTTPNVRIGNLGGLTFNSTTLSNQWGIFTNNGYYSGQIVANGGSIGGFEIGTNAIHTSGVQVTSNAENSVALSSSTFMRTINGTSRASLKFAIGSNFGVSSAGVLYVGNAIVSGQIISSSGTIGGWTLDANSLKNGTFGTANSAMMCTGTATAKSIGGSASISGWTFTSGANFGVTKTGTLYASDANIAGLITTNSITATGGELNIVDTNNNVCTTVNTNGLIVYKNNIQVASFGETSLIGKTSSGNVVTTSDGIIIKNGQNQLSKYNASGLCIYDGQGNADGNIVASFGANGATIGKVNSLHTTIESDNFNVSFDTDKLFDVSSDGLTTNVYIGASAKAAGVNYTDSYVRSIVSFLNAGCTISNDAVFAPTGDATGYTAGPIVNSANGGAYTRRIYDANGHDFTSGRYYGIEYYWHDNDGEFLWISRDNPIAETVKRQTLTMGASTISAYDRDYSVDSTYATFQDEGKYFKLTPLFHTLEFGGYQDSNNKSYSAYLYTNDFDMDSPEPYSMYYCFANDKTGRPNQLRIDNYDGDNGVLFTGTTNIDHIGDGSITGAINEINDAILDKQDTIVGGATTITSTNLTGSRALISNSNGKVAVSAVTSTELGYLDGVTSKIQTQLNNLKNTMSKTSSASATLSNTVWKTVTSVTVTAGTYLFIGVGRFGYNATGLRLLRFSETQNSNSEVGIYASSSHTAHADVYSYVQVVMPMEVSSSTTYYLNAWQNSGGNLSIDRAGICVIKIA